MIELVYFSNTPPIVEIMSRALDGLADIRMRRNIEQADADEAGNAPQYTAEEVYFTTSIINAPSESTITDNWDAWWKVGAWYGREGKAARSRRDTLLSSTDYMLMSDYPISSSDRDALIKYRQDLRDIPDWFDSPDVIIWPDKPVIRQNATPQALSIEYQHDDE